VTTPLLRPHLHIPSVKQEIKLLNFQHGARLNSHQKLSRNGPHIHFSNALCQQISCIHLYVIIIYIITF
jgi:hypothetical protein